MKMRLLWLGLGLVGIFLGIVATAQTKSFRAVEQMTSRPAATLTAPDGAFSKLLVGDQRTVHALYTAQQHALGNTSSPVRPERLSLDEIAAMKQDGYGWSHVFDEMKSRGLIQEKNFGQVIRKYGRNPSIMSDRGPSESRTTEAEPKS